MLIVCLSIISPFVGSCTLYKLNKQIALQRESVWDDNGGSFIWPPSSILAAESVTNRHWLKNNTKHPY